MCGEGGMPISEWARIKSYRTIRLWIEGYRRRYNTLYMIGYVVSRAAIAGRCEAPNDYPYDLDKVLGTATSDDEGMSTDEVKTDLLRMKEAMLKRHKEKLKDNGKQ